MMIFDTAKNSNYKVIFDMDDDILDFFKKNGIDYDVLISGKKYLDLILTKIMRKVLNELLKFNNFI